MSQVGAEAGAQAADLFRNFVPPRREALRTEIRQVDSVPSGLDGLWHDGIGAWKSRKSRSGELWQKARGLEELCRKCESWSDQEFKQELRQSRAKVKRLGDRWAEGVDENQHGTPLPICDRLRRMYFSKSSSRLTL